MRPSNSATHVLTRDRAGARRASTFADDARAALAAWRSVAGRATAVLASGESRAVVVLTWDDKEGGRAAGDFLIKCSLFGVAAAECRPSPASH